MNTNTFYKRLQALTTKEGTLKTRYFNPLWKLLNYPKDKIYPRQWVQNGRHSELLDHSTRFTEFFDALELSYTSGNDAPRGGQTGFYIVLTPEALRRLPSLDTLDYSTITKTKIKDLIK